MTHYELYPFKKDKAFIYEEGVKNGKGFIGNRICINTKGEKLFELSDADMFCFWFEDEDVAFVNFQNKEAMIKITHT